MNMTCLAGVAGPCGEGGLEVRELRDAGPDVLGGRAHDAEDPEQLVDLRVALEQRLLVRHLKKSGEQHFTFVVNS